jgi:hypothetical protein
VKEASSSSDKPERKGSMIREVCRIGIAASLALGLATTAAQGQAGTSVRSTTKPAAVAYLYPEQVNLPAGKPATVALHFRVAPGLHINSHAPRDKFLIPTTFSIPEGTSVRLQGADYPTGTDFTPPLDPGEKLNVYAGEFAIQARMVAAAGDHLVEGQLRYQACDQSACMPPKTITVAIDVMGK